MYSSTCIFSPFYSCLESVFTPHAIRSIFCFLFTLESQKNMNHTSASLFLLPPSLLEFFSLLFSLICTCLLYFGPLNLRLSTVSLANSQLQKTAVYLLTFNYLNHTHLLSKVSGPNVQRKNFLLTHLNPHFDSIAQFENFTLQHLVGVNSPVT